MDERRVKLSRDSFLRGEKLTCRNGRAAAVIVKTALRFAPKPPGFDIFYKQRTGPVFRISETFVQNLHDSEHGIKADEIGKLQRPHWVIGAKPHRGVNRFDRTDALIKRIDRFVDHWQQNTVDDKGRE